MGYQQFSPAQTARSINTTLARHLKEEEPAWMKNYQMLALIQANGRQEFNVSGAGFTWPVRKGVHALEGNTGQTARNFAPKNLWETAAQEIRGYQAVDQMYEREFLENRGDEAVISTFNSFATRLGESVKQQLGPECYVDGSAAGNEQSWHGLDSMFAINGTVNISTGAQRSANAADIVGYPNDTYADLSTVLGNYGGAQESSVVWPLGVCDPEFDFWSPLIVNYTSTELDGSADTWVAQGDEAMRYGIIHSQRNSSMDGQMTNIFLDRELYRDFLNSQDTKEQINITPENSLRALGFRNTFFFDGVEVSWEAAVPTTVGYGLNFGNIRLLSMYDSLWKNEETFYDPYTQSYNAVVKTLSNFCFKSPRRFVKWDNLA